MKTSALVPLLLVATSVLAAPWSFSAPVEVTHVHGQGIFHHLGSGGRNAIAVSFTGEVALVWEDNRDGKVRCYIGRRSSPHAEFDDLRISGNEACYEPAVTTIDDSQFVVAWEEIGAVWIRIVAESGLGPPLKLSSRPASQVAITGSPETGLVAAWSQREGDHTRIWTARIEREDHLALRITRSQAADKEILRGDQAYPDIVILNGERVQIAWEDRRKGHTAILAAQGDVSLDFSIPQQINESFWGGHALGYGRGTGAMRVSLASADGNQVIAVWADKRDFRSGYDIYSAIRRVESAEFDHNEKVQDDFADMVAQWHPEVASGPFGTDLLVASVWDDDREGTQDIWLSWRSSDQWSDDLEVPGASGPGVQIEPAIALDSGGNFHLAWVEKDHISGPSRIRYQSGTPKLTNIPDKAQ